MERVAKGRVRGRPSFKVRIAWASRLATRPSATPNTIMSSGQLVARHYRTRANVRITWHHDQIQSVEPCPGPPADDWIAPALLDPQVNGYAGIDFQADRLTAEQLLHAAAELRRAGCTRFLLTLMTDHWPRLLERLRHLKSLRDDSPVLTRAIAGWHLEGPFLSSQPGFHGAHDPARMTDPSPAHVAAVRQLLGTDPCLLTLAPERPGALETIRAARDLAITISLGHTNASSEQLAQAIQAGATGFTHLGNACPNQLDRHDNILWRVLDSPNLTVSLIPDAIHVSPPLFRLVHRLLGLDSLIYTTDAMAAAGAPPGPYPLGPMIVHVGPDGIVRQPGRSNFAGSALRPIDGVHRAARMLNTDWQNLWDGFSTRPRRFLGLPHGLEPGQPADFCLLQPSRAFEGDGLVFTPAHEPVSRHPRWGEAPDEP